MVVELWLECPHLSLPSLPLPLLIARVQWRALGLVCLCLAASTTTLTATAGYFSVLCLLPGLHQRHHLRARYFRVNKITRIGRRASEVKGQPKIPIIEVSSTQSINDRLREVPSLPPSRRHRRRHHHRSRRAPNDFLSTTVKRGQTSSTDDCLEAPTLKWVASTQHFFFPSQSAFRQKFI